MKANLSPLMSSQFSNNLHLLCCALFPDFHNFDWLKVSKIMISYQVTFCYIWNTNTSHIFAYCLKLFFFKSFFEHYNSFSCSFLEKKTKLSFFLSNITKIIWLPNIREKKNKRNELVNPEPQHMADWYRILNSNFTFGGHIALYM